MPQANVLDIYYQDNMLDKHHAIDFAGLWNSGIICIAHKASQGTHFRDPLYAVRRAQCFKAAPQMLWMAYHFLDASDVDAQSGNFLGACGFDDPNMPMPALAADYEPNAGNTPALHQLQSFCVNVDRAAPGILTFIYSSNLIRETLQPLPGGHLHSDMIGAPDFFQRHPLWLAEYGPKEMIPWPWNTPAPNETVAPGAVLWQFNDHGRFAQLLGAVDVNYFAGTRDDLAKYWPNNGAVL